mgnify:CR=1 FL=1
MENFELNYDFNLSNNDIVTNVALYDEKEIIDNADEIKIFGKLYIDLMYDNENVIHEKRDFNITLNKCKYNKKDIKVRINDYDYSQKENIVKLKINYEVDGEDVPVSNFCFLNNSSLENELRDFLSRNENTNINLNDENIVILDPVIKDEKKKVEIKTNEVNEIRNNNEKDVLFKEKYQSSYIFYRIKKGEDLFSISKKFNIKEDIIKKLNDDKEFIENNLIQIPLKNV